MSNNLDQFHLDHNFCTKIYRLSDKMSVITQYPGYYLNNLTIPEEERIYNPIKESGLNIIFKENDQINEKFYEIPFYLCRPYIAMDIILTSFKRNVGYELFYFFDEKLNLVNTKSIMMFLTPDLSEENRIKEKNITEMFSDILYGINCEGKAINLGVDDGYYLLRDLINKNGCSY